MEILPFILKWIPHVKVMSPNWLVERVEKYVEAYFFK